MECVTYIIASFVGDWFKGKLILTNVIAAAALAFICLFWPLVDINYGIILLISLCEYITALCEYITTLCEYITYLKSVYEYTLPVSVSIS